MTALELTDDAVAGHTTSLGKLDIKTKFQSASLIDTLFKGSLISYESNVVSGVDTEYVVLNQSETHNNIFKGKTSFESDITLTNGKRITTSSAGTMFLGGDNLSSIQILTNDSTGVITLVANEIKLNATTVTVNGVNFNCNALFTEGATVDGNPTITSQWSSTFGL